MKRKLIAQIDEQLYDGCKEQAKKEERSLSGLVRQAMKEYLDSKEAAS